MAERGRFRKIRVGETGGGEEMKRTIWRSTWISPLLVACRCMTHLRRTNAWLLRSLSVARNRPNGPDATRHVPLTDAETCNRRGHSIARNSGRCWRAFSERTTLGTQPRIMRHDPSCRSPSIERCIAHRSTSNNRNQRTERTTCRPIFRTGSSPFRFTTATRPPSWPTSATPPAARLLAAAGRSPISR